MKVLHVTNYFRDTHDHVGGAEQACYRTARMTAEHDHEVAVVTLPMDHPERAAGLAPLRLTALPVLEDRLPETLGRYLEAAKWYTLQYDPLAGRAFGRLLERSKPDVVHCHNFQFLTFSLVRAARARRVPTCLSIYDYWHFCPKAMLARPDNTFCSRAHSAACVECLPKTMVLAQKALLSQRRRVFDACFEAIDRFVVLSEHSRGVLTGYGIPPRKISVVPLTLPLEYREDAQAAPDLGLGPHALLFAGWLNDRKGVHIAIEAMPQVLARIPDATLYVIGGRAKFANEYEARFERFVREHGLAGSVVFLGHQTPEAVQRYLQNVDVLVLPEQYQNMSPLVMVEAMMLGTPVVASNLGGIPEYISDGRTGFLADAYDPADFAGKIVRLLEDPALRSRVAGDARAFIRTRNDNETVWRATEAVYRDLCATAG
jgi:glycosyltransferase involved in cell wall biosynthesis